MFLWLLLFLLFLLLLLLLLLSFLRAVDNHDTTRVGCCRRLFALPVFARGAHRPCCKHGVQSNPLALITSSCEWLQPARHSRPAERRWRC